MKDSIPVWAPSPGVLGSQCREKASSVARNLAAKYTRRAAELLNLADSIDLNRSATGLVEEELWKQLCEERAKCG